MIFIKLAALLWLSRYAYNCLAAWAVRRELKRRPAPPTPQALAAQDQLMVIHQQRLKRMGLIE